ncbi:hypothetical protein [Bacillus sp. USDA818B3_A]|uniref:hypothetical protein n=1 Tax=Bacillus sp. USDA818B3_A TaxID=2698834 RepID=UPI00136FF2E8|nr:hypothetical protein [Bacillus sp. USDA818B3_A]
MTNQTVNLSKKTVENYLFQRLKFCKKCQRYSVLRTKKCPECGRHYKKVSSLVTKILIKRVLTETTWILTMTALAAMFAPVKQTIYCLAAGAVFWVSCLVLTVLFSKSQFYYQLKKSLRKDIRKIQAGIRFDCMQAEAEEREGKLEEAYDKLREIGEFVQSDELKKKQVKLLNKLPLKAGSDFDLERLIPASYDKNFVKYLLKVITNNRAQITKRCIAYCVQYRRNIELDFGKEKIVAIADTALRMKLYILEFSAFIEEFLDFMPKVRLLRLYKVIHKNPNVDWGKLQKRTIELVERNYCNDPDFKMFMGQEKVTSHA